MPFEIPSKLHFVHRKHEMRLKEVERLSLLAASLAINEVYVWADRNNIHSLIENFMWCNEVSEEIMVFDDFAIGKCNGVRVNRGDEWQNFFFSPIESLPPLTNPLILTQEVEYTVGDALPSDIIGFWAVHHMGGVFVARKSTNMVRSGVTFPAYVNSGLLLCERKGEEVPFTHLVMAGAKGAQEVKDLCAVLADFHYFLPPVQYDVPSLRMEPKFSDIKENQVRLRAGFFQPLFSQKKVQHRAVARESTSELTAGQLQQVEILPCSPVNFDYEDEQEEAGRRLGAHTSNYPPVDSQSISRPIACRSAGAKIWEWMLSKEMERGCGATRAHSVQCYNVEELCVRYSLQRNLRGEVQLKSNDPRFCTAEECRRILDRLMRTVPRR